jgi:hypothetical protein
MMRPASDLKFSQGAQIAPSEAVTAVTRRIELMRRGLPSRGDGDSRAAPRLVLLNIRAFHQLGFSLTPATHTLFDVRALPQRDHCTNDIRALFL